MEREIIHIIYTHTRIRSWNCASQGMKERDSGELTELLEKQTNPVWPQAYHVRTEKNSGRILFKMKMQ